jgi:hypothetical protein
MAHYDADGAGAIHPIRSVSVQEERSEYPVLLVRKKTSAFEADCEAISRTSWQNKNHACN